MTPDPWRHGRSRADVEADVLVAALHNLDDRRMITRSLRPGDLTSSWHRAILRALDNLDDTTLPPHVALARRLGVPVADVEDWATGTCPNTPISDLARLLGSPA